MELIPGERWPAQRGIGAIVPDAMTLRIRDMPHMAQYVYDMYLDRVRQCKDQYEVRFSSNARKRRTREGEDILYIMTQSPRETFTASAIAWRFPATVGVVLRAASNG